MEKVVVELEVKSKKGIKEVKTLKKELSNTKDEAKKTTQSLNGVAGGAIGKLNGLKSSIGGVVKGFKSLRFAIIASGIGALLLAVLAVGKAFTNSEEGQNKFAKIMGVIGSVTGNLVDILASLGEKIISVFENPKQAISDFSNLIKDNIINRFNGLLELIPQLSKSIKQLFSGDFSGAAETAANAVAKVALGTDNLTDSIKNSAKALRELAAEVAADAVVAANIADKRAKADKLDRQLITERAQATRDIAELRLKSEQKDKFAVAERIKFLQEANAIEEATTNKAIESAKLRRDAIIEENKLSGSTKDDLDAEAQAKAKIIQLDTSRLNLSKRLATRLLEFRNEELAGIKKVSDAKKKELEKDSADAIKKQKEDAKARKIIEELEANTEEEKRILALEKEKIKFEEAILLATEQGLSIEELERSQKESLQLMRDGFAQTDVDRAVKIAATKKAIEDKSARDAEIISDAKIKTMEMSANAVIGIVGRESKVGKAVAVAQAIWNTKNAITKTLATVPSPFNIPQAIATGVFGLAQVKGILSTPNPMGGGGGIAGGGGGVSAPTSAPSIPPAFNVVGQSGTDQLASAIGGQSQQPTRAYVVSSDVTTSQEMDRNIVTGASL
jgi:hypothetical protein